MDVTVVQIVGTIKNAPGLCRRAKLKGAKGLKLKDLPLDKK